jgi:hypothetical protein
MLVGKREFSSSKTGKEYTTAFLVYDDKETIGQACKDALINGHDLPDDLVGQEVEVEIDFGGRVQGIVPVMPVEPVKKAG